MNFGCKSALRRLPRLNLWLGVKLYSFHLNKKRGLASKGGRRKRGGGEERRERGSNGGGRRGEEVERGGRK